MVTGHVAGERHEPRTGCHPAEPEIERDLPGPHRRVDERPMDVRDRRVAHPAVCRRDLARSRFGSGVSGVARFVEKRPPSVTKAPARQGDRRPRLGRGPRRGPAVRSECGADVAGLRVVVGHPLGRASVRRAGRLVLGSQLRRLAGVLERSLPVVLGAHQLPVPGTRRPRRAAATKATTAPALASKPAATAASVAGTTFSCTGESALAGNP